MLIYTGVKKTHTEKKIKLKFILELFQINLKKKLVYNIESSLFKKLSVILFTNIKALVN